MGQNRCRDQDADKRSTWADVPTATCRGAAPPLSLGPPGSADWTPSQPLLWTTGGRSARTGLCVGEAVRAEITPAILETVQQGRLQTLVPLVNMQQIRDTFRAALLTMTPEWTQRGCPSSGAWTNHMITT